MARPAAVSAGDAALASWAEAALDYVDEIDAKVKTIWLMPHVVQGTGAVLSAGATGDFSGSSFADPQDDNVRFVVPIPSDFSTLTKAVVVVLPAGTGDMYRDVTTDFAATGEAYNTHSDSIAKTAVGVTNGQIFDDDISAAFTGIAAGDRVGVVYKRWGADALDTVGTTVYVLGLLLEYT
uniref:Uncharacterized protein n=1 Tax=viral metagenome TaxID=1070528 RepID=A0A6M3KDE3_9ZZZZ